MVVFELMLQLKIILMQPTLYKQAAIARLTIFRTRRHTVHVLSKRLLEY